MVADDHDENTYTKRRVHDPAQDLSNPYYLHSSDCTRIKLVSISFGGTACEV